MKTVTAELSRLDAVLSGRSEYGRTAAAAAEAEKLAAEIVKAYSGRITLPAEKLRWLRGTKAA